MLVKSFLALMTQKILKLYETETSNFNNFTLCGFKMLESIKRKGMRRGKLQLSRMICDIPRCDYAVRMSVKRIINKKTKLGTQHWAPALSASEGLDCIRESAKIWCDPERPLRLIEKHSLLLVQRFVMNKMRCQLNSVFRNFLSKASGRQLRPTCSRHRTMLSQTFYQLICGASNYITCALWIFV